MLRAGIGMLDGMTRLLPTADVGFVGMVRDEESLVASTYADEVITTHGVVRDKTPLEDGVRFSVEIWASNEAGETKTVGTVEVTIP